MVLMVNGLLVLMVNVLVVALRVDLRVEVVEVSDLVYFITVSLFCRRLFFLKFRFNWGAVCLLCT
jgi:hypothetical protein